jgi:short-subunit dehydrogenase
MPKDLHGTVALITGASSGIGRATAAAFAAAGANVIVTARREDRLRDLALRIGGQPGAPEVLPLAGDLLRLEDLRRISASGLAWKGQVDFLVNNAGFGRIRWLEELDPLHDIEEQIRLDLVSCILLTREILPAMIARHSGCIINVSSLAGLVGAPTNSVYSAAKFGLRGFGEALDREVGGLGIRVCTFCPGPVETEFESHAGRPPELQVRGAARWRSRPERVAQRIVALATHPQSVVVWPGFAVPVVWLNTLFPGLVGLLTDRFYVRRIRGGGGVQSERSRGG